MKRFLLFLALVCFAAKASAQGGVFIEDGLEYHCNIPRAILRECTDKQKVSVVIPGRIYATYWDWDYENDIVGYCSVDGIYAEAFEDCTNLQSVELPNTIEKIGGYAFLNCSSLKSIVIPNSVRLLGADLGSEGHAFERCTSLESVTLSNSMTCLYFRTFGGCTKLRDITIPNQIQEIRDQVFYGCSALEAITLPMGVKTIGSKAFADCTRLVDVTNLALTPQTISDDTFTTYGTLHVLKGLKGIYEAADGWKNFTIVDDARPNNTIIYTTSDDERVAINQYETAYSWGNTRRDNHRYDNGVGVITFYDDLTTVGSNVFKQSLTLTSVSLPNTVTSIGSYAFQNCSYLLDVELPGDLRTIGHYAFQNCGGLNTICLPSCVESIGEQAFGGCSRLEDVTCLSPTPPTITAFTFTKYGTLHVLPGSKAAYEAADHWKNFTIVDDVVDPTKRTITFGANDYATYCTDANLDLSQVEGLKAYVASSYNPQTGSLTITRVTNVPAGEGVLLVGAAGESYDVPTTDDASIVANLLRGTTTATELPVTDVGNINYILADTGAGVSFTRLATGISVPANTAWLQMPIRRGQIDSISLTIAEQQGIAGDANGDGKLTIGDIVNLTNMILGSVSGQ